MLKAIARSISAIKNHLAARNHMPDPANAAAAGFDMVSALSETAAVRVSGDSNGTGDTIPPCDDRDRVDVDEGDAGSK